MVKVTIGVLRTPGQEGVDNADGRCISEGRSDVVLIIPHQIAFINDVDDLLGVFVPILSSKGSCRILNLTFQAGILGGNTESPLQCSLYAGNVLILHLPKVKRAGGLPGSGIRYIKDIANSGLIATVVNQCNALRATLHIAAHGVVPQIILGAGCCIRPLSMDHQLLMVRIFVEPSCGAQERSPALPTACDLPCCFIGHFCIVCGFRCHPFPPSIFNQHPPGKNPAAQIHHR